MPVKVGVVAEGDVVIVLQANQTSHRLGRGAVHANAPVMVQPHEPEGRVRMGVMDGDVQPVALRDRPPVAQAGATQGVGAEADAGGADDLEINDLLQVGHIGADVVMLPDLRTGQRRRQGQPPHRAVPVPQQAVGAFRNPLCHVRVRRPAMRRVVLDAAVFGRIV